MEPVQFGDPRLPGRFWAKISRGVGTGCWLWTGSLSVGGYGRYAVNRRPKTAHRVIFEALVHSVEPPLDLDHLCRVRRCVNPEHLEPVTRSENTLRGLLPSVVAAGNRRAAALATHCANGHLYTPSNLYVAPGGQRRCRTCRRANDRLYQERQRNKGLNIG